MINVKDKPFYLDNEGIEWVNATLQSLSLKEKIGQLFCPIIFTKDSNELKSMIKEFSFGGVLYREGMAEEIRASHEILQNASKVPLLTASNLEMGGKGSATEGTYYGRQMLVAATNNLNRAYELGKISAIEGKALGVNWAFAPVVDIDYNFRNPITNVRTYGANLEKIKSMAGEYIKAATEEGIATAVKHFPGDGVDERDQHLLTSVNSLDYETWDKTYGDIYKSVIDAGTLSIMVAHIAFPDYEKKCGASIEQCLMPATLSKNVIKKLLREELKFNGLLCTDATPMIGFCSAMDRKTAVPLCIENGCDVFLFNKDIREDFTYMIQGYENGILSEKRLNEAVYRILATKAALKLYKNKQNENYVLPKEGLNVLGCKKHMDMAKLCADEGITLVKDTQNLLPLHPKKTPNLLLQILGESNSNERVRNRFVTRLQKEGFFVTVYEKETNFEQLDNCEEFKRKYDLVLYVGNIETVSNKTVARVNWDSFFGLGNNMPWFVKEVPTIFVSVGNPYHLFDIPMIKTFINCYCNTDIVISTVIDKMIGLSPFKGVNPIDPFCGRADTEY